MTTLTPHQLITAIAALIATATIGLLAGAVYAAIRATLREVRNLATETRCLRRELRETRRILTRKADVHSIILDGLSARHDDAHRKLNRVIHQAREILTLCQLTRKEVNTHMSDLNEITAAIYDAVLAIGEALLAADPDDKAQIAALQQQLAGELAKSEAFRDPERLERTRAFLAAAAAATPATPVDPPPTGDDEPAEPAPITEA